MFSSCGPSCALPDHCTEKFLVPLVGTAAMKGMWRNPFGLRNFAIGDMAISLSLNWKSGIPTGFGITGKMEIGTRKMSFALAVDATAGVLLSGSISKLALRDILIVGVRCTSFSHLLFVKHAFCCAVHIASFARSPVVFAVSFG